MPLSAELYQKYGPIVRGKVPRPEGISDEYMTALTKAVDEYENQYLSGVERAGPARQEPEAAPGELGVQRVMGPGGQEAPPVEPSGDALRLNPSFSLIPQALSVQPATTDPEGDESAEAKWKREGKPEGGSLIYYEVPLQQAKKDLLEHPERLRALYPGMGMEPGDPELTPEAIINAGPDSQVIKAYRDMTWRDTAAAAAAAGKTAYRYSAMPWLAEKGGLGANLSQLALKFNAAGPPAAEAAMAFIGGQDDTANFGLGRAAVETGLGAVGAELPADVVPGGPERVGGISTSDPQERLQQIEEEHPIAHGLGQVKGIFSEWGLANGLIQRALGLEKAAAGRGFATRAAAGAAAGTLGAAGVVGAQAGVDVAKERIQSALGMTPATSTQLSDIPERAGEAALFGAPLAIGGGLLGAGAQAHANQVRWGEQYGGAPGRLEQKGVKFGIFRGPIRPDAWEARRLAARKGDFEPQDELVNILATPVRDILKGRREAALKTIEEGQSQYLTSREGRQLLPANNFINQNVTELRRAMKAQRPRGVPQPVGTSAEANDLKDFLNTNATFSATPVQGAIAISPEEAAAYLTPYNQNQLLRRGPGGGGPAGPGMPGGGGAPPGGAPAPGAGGGGPPGSRWQRTGKRPEPGVPAGEEMERQELIPVTPPGRRMSSGGATPLDDIVPSGAPSGGATPVEGLSGAPAVGEADRRLMGQGRLSREERAARPTEMMGERQQGYIEAESRLAGARAGMRSQNAAGERLLKEFPEAGAQPITPEARQKVAERLEKDLTPKQRAAIKGYTGARYFEANEALRGNRVMSPDMKNEINELTTVFDNAVNKGNVLPGKTQRGISVSEDELAALQKADTITAQGFVSHSDNPKVAEQFSEWGASDERPIKVIFEMEQSTGVPIGKGQGELVHRPGTQYTVTGKEQRGDVHVFKVRESGYQKPDLSKAVKAAAGAAIIGGGLLAVGQSDDENAPMAAAAGGAALFAKTLRRRGIHEVYVVPKRYDAQGGEALLDAISNNIKRTEDSRMRRLDHAARLDRDQRTLNGAPGGWSKLQNKHHELLNERELEERLATPGGEAHKVLTSHSYGGRGKKREQDIISGAAKEAGLEKELGELRGHDELEDLRRQTRWSKSRRRGEPGVVERTLDLANIRMFPVSQAISGPLRPALQRLPRVQELGDEKGEKERRKKQLQEKSK